VLAISAYPKGRLILTSTIKRRMKKRKRMMKRKRKRMMKRKRKSPLNQNRNPNPFIKRLSLNLRSKTKT